MPNFTLTTTGQDNFNRADSSTLGANWNTPSGSGSIGIQGNQAYGEGLRPAQTYWKTSVQPNQFAQVTWEGSPNDPLTGYIDVTLRRNPSSDSAYWIVNLSADGSTGAYTADNSNRAGYVDSWSLPAPLNAGDVILVVAYQTAIYIYVNGTLVHTSTLPQISPTGGTADGSGCAGFDLSYVGLADSWDVGTAAQAAVLSVSPASLSFIPSPYGFHPTGALPAAAQGKIAGNGSLIVSNSGGGTSMPFTVSSDVAWMLVSPGSGDAGSSPQTVTVILNMNSSSLKGGIVGLADQKATGHITVNAGSAGSVTVPVTLSIGGFGI